MNWVTGVTSDDGVLSQAERLESRQNAPIQIVSPNSAESGATILTHFVNQARRIKANLSPLPAPRYTTVWLGHNDICGGMIDKVNATCPAGSDQDLHNHCWTTPEAFEREFRKGLDILITVPELKIGVASLGRLSQMCNHSTKTSCSPTLGEGPCRTIWQTAPSPNLPSGFCGSLTSDCSDERVQDALAKRHIASETHRLPQTAQMNVSKICIGWLDSTAIFLTG